MERLISSFKYISHTLTQIRIMMGMLGIVAILSWIGVYASAETGQLKVHFFDVGQGDAIFIEMPDGRQILIDGGRDDKVVEKLNSAMSFWDRSIDMVIATHQDADHITGLVSVLEHYEVDTVIWNGVTADTKIFQEFKKVIEAEGAEVLVGECCMRFTLSDIVFFEILYPRNPTGSDPVGLKSQNDFSLVIRLVYGDDSFLFTGDVERQGEYEILKQNLRIESDVLKVAHHGSKTSSSELFVEKINPKIAIISAGRRNPYGHPHEAILQRLGKYKVGIRRTDNEGDILLVSDGDSF